MSNFNLRPIPKEIRYKLLQKQKAFARQSITESTSANKSLELGDDFLQFHNRSTWAHMIGLSVISGEDDKKRIAIIGAGELNQEPGANEPLMKSSFDSIYSPLKDNKNTLYRPISGIKSISTRYEGDIKSRRECTVNFTVFSLEDLDRLSPYFFRIGTEVLVEFGWNQATDTDSSMFNTSLGHKIIDIYNKSGVSGFNNDSGVIDLLKENTAENYETEILKHSGDYEYVLGQISNFEYSLRDDGGFDCVVKIQTVGMSLLDTKVDREYSPSAISAGNAEAERKREFTSPDEVSDEFYLMMHNLPEIVYGSLIQGYSRTPRKGISYKGKTKKASSDFGDGIDPLDAAFYLMGGMPIDTGNQEIAYERQQFTLSLMIEAYKTGWDYWTRYEPLVAVFQEALLEQGQTLPSGADGGFGPETKKAIDGFYIPSGSSIMKNWNDPQVTDYKKKANHIAKSLFTEGVQDDDPTDNYPLVAHMEHRQELAIPWLRSGREGKRQKKFNTTKVPNPPPFITATEDPIDVPENFDDDTPEIESKFYIWQNSDSVVNGEHITTQDIGTPTETQNKITIFTSYRQKKTTQIFTGFNWNKSKKDFDKLSETYAEESYRDNLIPKGRKKAHAREKAQPDNRGHSVSPISFNFISFPAWWPDFLKPEWAKLPEGDPDTPFVSTEKARKSKKTKEPLEATDEFLEWVEESIPPNIWIRWGWFEDNILTRYLGYIPDVDTGGYPVSLFKSVEPKINDEGKIITGYESNKIGLPKDLLTTDVKQVLIPDRVEGLEKSRHLVEGIPTGRGEDFNFYGSLGKFLNSELKGSEGVGISPVEIPHGKSDEYRRGYIRNLFVEASTLQQAFLNIGTLKEGIDRFISIMYNNFGKIHQLEVQQGRDDNMVGIVDTNLISDKAIWKNISKSPGTLKEEANKIRVFEFPAWEKESIVKSQDLKVTIPNEMAITALYSGNEHMRNLGIYDESRGSVEAQKLSKFLRLDSDGKDVAKKSISERLTGLSPIITSKKLTISGDGENEVGKHRYIVPDPFLTTLNKELLRSIGKRDIYADTRKKEEKGDTDGESSVDKRVSYALNIEEMKSKFQYGYYNSKGTLEESHPFNMRRIMEYELQYHTNAVQTNYPTINGLLDLSLTIDGTAGIFPGNSYISKYLPKAWQARPDGIQGGGEYPILFQASDISHEISSDGWNTMITGMPRMNPNAFPYEFVVKDNDGDMDIIKRPASLAISEYSNFFNLNYNFASKSLLGDNFILEGINTTVWSENNKPGSLEELGVKDAITRLRKPDSALRDGQYEQGDISEYADFSEVLKSLKKDEVTIPSITVEQTAPTSGVTYYSAFEKYSKITGKHAIPAMKFSSNEELLLFLQMSIIISGLAYYGLKKPTEEVVYEDMLADTFFESHRPKILQKPGTSLSILVSKKNIGESVASKEYFKAVPHSYTGKDRFFYPAGYDAPIYPYIWQKKKHYDGDDVPGKSLLIGPARFTPPGTRQTNPGDTLTSKYPFNEEIKIFESIFKTLLKNEFRVNSWLEFDQFIAHALRIPAHVPPTDSEKVFKYALDCEYRIRVSE